MFDAQIARQRLSFAEPTETKEKKKKNINIRANSTIFRKIIIIFFMPLLCCSRHDYILDLTRLDDQTIRQKYKKYRKYKNYKK